MGGGMRLPALLEVAMDEQTEGVCRCVVCRCRVSVWSGVLAQSRSRPSVWRVTRQINALRGTKVVYIGNLSFQTTEPQIHQYFSKVG